MQYDKKNDYYDLLGVSVTIEPPKLKAAYYKLA